MESLIELDKSIFVFLNNLGIEFFDNLWLIITDKKSSIPLYLILIFFLYKTLKRYDFIKYLIVIIILITLTDQTSGLFKDYFERIEQWKSLFEPYLIQSFEIGGSGADIALLESKNNVLAGLRPDSQRYFDYHHASIDTFDAINKRELELGTFSMASLVYLFDKYGIVK